MAGTTLIIDDAGVQRTLGKVLSKLSDFSGPFKEFGEYLTTETQDRFDAERSPDGAPWKPLNENYRAWKVEKRGFDKILTFDSNLRDRIVYDAGRQSFEMGTNVVYAAIHQFGGRTGRGHKANMPARPFLGVNEQDADELQTILNDHIFEK